MSCHLLIRCLKIFYLFKTCLWLVHELFMKCWFVHDLFMTYLWVVHDLFLTYWLVHDWFTTCSFLDTYFFTNFSRLVHNFLQLLYESFWICSRLVHDSFRTFLQSLVDNWFKTCSIFVGLCTTCLWLAHDLFPNIFTASSYFSHDLFSTCWGDLFRR